MTETNQARSSVDCLANAQLRAELKEMMRQKEVTQRQLVAGVVELGIKFSTPTMNRVVKGKRPLKDEELKAICQVLGEEQRYEELRLLLSATDSLPGNKERDMPSPPASPQRPQAQADAGVWSTVRNFIRRHIAWVVGSLVVALLASVVTIVVIVQAAPDTSDATSAKSAVGDDRGPAQTPGCDRYEVAPQDLWLRDEYGSPRVQLLHGRKVTVKNATNLRGHDLWEITTEDDQTGWVDAGYLKAVC